MSYWTVENEEDYMQLKDAPEIVQDQFDSRESREFNRYGGIASPVDPGRTMSFQPSILDDGPTSTTKGIDPFRNEGFSIYITKDEQVERTQKTNQFTVSSVVAAFASGTIVRAIGKEVKEIATPILKKIWAKSKPTLLKIWEVIYNL